MPSVSVSVADVIVSLEDLAKYFPPLSVPIAGLKAAAVATGTLNTKISIPVPELPDVPSPPPPAPLPSPGGDPIAPLTAIASAISSAENILNDDNLVISQAAVEVNMNVSLPGIAGANTTIKFGVEPRSL